MSKLSIIIPAATAEKTIDRCLRSITENNKVDAEIIIVVNNSVDNTLGKCRDWQKDYSNLIVIESDARNVSQARNEGLKVALGDVIGFCDADDYYESSVLDDLLDKMADADVLVFGFNRVMEDGRVISEHQLSGGVRSVNKMRCDLINNPNMMGSVWNKLYRKDFLQGVFFDEKITHCEDMDFNLRALKREDVNVMYTDLTGYNYVHSASSATNAVNSVFDENDKLRYLYSMEKIQKEYAGDRRIQKEIGFKIATLCIDNYSDELDLSRKQGLTLNIKNNIKYLWAYLYKYEPRENYNRLKKALGIIKK